MNQLLQQMINPVLNVFTDFLRFHDRNCGVQCRRPLKRQVVEFPAIGQAAVAVGKCGCRATLQLRMDRNFYVHKILFIMLHAERLVPGTLLRLVVINKTFVVIINFVLFLFIFC